MKKLFVLPNIIMATLFVSSLVFALLYVTNKGRIAEKREMLKILEEEICYLKQENGISKAKILAFTSKNSKDFISLETKDPTVNRLQKEVKNNKKQIKNQGSATVFRTVTRLEKKSETLVMDEEFKKVKTLLSKDTIIKVVNYYPRYASEFQLDKWVKGIIIVDKDSTSIDLVIKNEYSVIIGEDRKNLFSKNKTFVEVTNNNPYSETKSLRTYKVKRKEKRFGIGPNIGVHIGNTKLLTPSIGIGLQYNLIRF